MIGLSKTIERVSCKALAVVTLIVTATHAAAVPVRHDFDLQLNVNQALKFIWDYQVKASASSRTAPFDTDSDAGNIGRPNGADPPGVDAKSVDAVSNGANAEAKAAFSANAGGQGFHEVEAIANRGTGTGASAFARSQFSYITGTKDGRGRIRWNPRWSVSQLDTQTGLRRTTIGDPIVFHVEDLDTGEAFDSELFALEFLLDSNGVASWEDGLVSVDADSGSFSVVMESEFITSDTGALRAEFAGGLMVLSEDSGIFDGLLPAVGAPAIFDFDFGDPEGFINIDFDFGAENVNGYSVMAEFGASASVIEMPGPATFSLVILGIVALTCNRRPRGRRCAFGPILWLISSVRGSEA